MGLAHNPKIVTDGLVLCLDAANPKSYPGSGTTWNDLSKNGNDGTLTNGVGYSSDNKGALTFDGVDDYVVVSNDTSLQVNNFTLSGWVFPINNSINGHIIRKEGSYILSHYWNGNTQKIGIWMQRTGGWESTHANIDVPLNQWCHIAGTYDNSFVRIYYNSAQVASTSKSGQTRITTNTVDINGTVSNSIYQNYNAGMIQIYNRALTESEIKQNFAATRGRYGI